MRGPEEAGALIRDMLSALMPAKIADLRSRLDIEDDALPEPVEYIGYGKPPLDLDRWPTIMVLPQAVADINIVDRTAEGVEYELTYPIRVFGFVRDQSFEATHLQRDRMTLAVRECILGYMGAAHAARVRDESLRESYSEIDESEQRTLGGFYIEFSLILSETLVTTATTPVGSVTVEAQLLD